MELVGKLDDGKGDTIELTLANAKDSKMVHSIDLHATTGPGGGAAFLQGSATEALLALEAGGTGSGIHS